MTADSNWHADAGSMIVNGVEVILEDAEWLRYGGMWGTTPGPALQTWWRTAECPLSRNAFLRVVGHLWPERQQV